MTLTPRLMGMLSLLENLGYVRHVFPRNALSVSSMLLTQAIKSYCPDFLTILDVGANIGQFALAASYQFPAASIYSFEPVPGAYSRLLKNVRQLSKVRTFPLAVGEKSGSMKFFVNRYSQVSSALRIAADNDQANYSAAAINEIAITMVTLDDFLKDKPFNGPILLKLDVQGYEREVLLGARKTLQRVNYIVLQIPFVCLYEGQASFDQLHTVLNELGFTLLAPVGLNRGKFNLIIEMDFLYQKKDIKATLN